MRRLIRSVGLLTMLSAVTTFPQPISAAGNRCLGEIPTVVGSADREADGWVPWDAVELVLT